MACVEVNCLVAPCPQICDGQIVTGSPQRVDPVRWGAEPLQSSNIDPRLLMYAPKTITRNPGTYTGGQYPSSTTPNTQPDFRVETESLDYWRFVLLAIGIVIGAAIIKRM